LDAEHVQRSKLRIDGRKWYLSKLAQKKYGYRLEIEHNASDDLAKLMNEARKR
jgi:hypothetical protein